MTTATVDRNATDHALLCAADGRVWDVYGDNWAEIVAEAEVIAQSEGLTIEVFNSEMPEA